MKTKIITVCLLLSLNFVTCANADSSTGNQSPVIVVLTLPHPMVRIVVAEQIYRAWSILKRLTGLVLGLALSNHAFNGFYWV